MLKTLGTGAPACVTVTLVDGLVLARSAFHHSINYRSVVVVGTATEISDPAEKAQALDAIVEHIVPGRLGEVRAPTENELRATRAVWLPARRGLGQAAHGPAEGRRRGLRASRVGGRAAAGAQAARAGRRPAAARRDPAARVRLGLAARPEARLALLAGAAARPAGRGARGPPVRRRAGTARPAPRDAAPHPARRPDRGCGRAGGARRGRGGAPRARRDPAAGALRVGNARRAGARAARRSATTSRSTASTSASRCRTGWWTSRA